MSISKLNSNNQCKSVGKPHDKKKIVQSYKQNKETTHLTQAEFEEMNQIEWVPFDPYCD